MSKLCWNAIFYKYWRELHFKHQTNAESWIFFKWTDTINNIFTNTGWWRLLFCTKVAVQGGQPPFTSSEVSFGSTCIHNVRWLVANSCVVTELKKELVFYLFLFNQKNKHNVVFLGSNRCMIAVIFRSLLKQQCSDIRSMYCAVRIHWLGCNLKF